MTSFKTSLSKNLSKNPPTIIADAGIPSVTVNKIRKGKPRKSDKIEQKDKYLKKAYLKLIKKSEEFIDKATISLDHLEKVSFIEDFQVIKDFIKYGKIIIYV